MADVYTRIGYIKGATGAQGERGLQGDPGQAATIEVGSVTTVPYGQTANVQNSGTSSAAVFDFTIPQGRPGEQTTDMENLTLGSITTSSASFPIPAVGETGKVLWGKVVKWFSDMSALVATKLNIANVVNNLTTTDSGYALDARQANPNVGGSLASQIPRTTGGNPYIIEGRVATVEFTDGTGTITFQHTFTNVLSIVATTIGTSTTTAAFIKVRALNSTSATIICNNISDGSSTINPGSGNINIYYIAIGV